ncbi:N-terminal glutamine amidase-domain-containing protein [Protomyces lactucae-debilis]|uniref:Protein N-terminal glutamine amidohydrolase n=1 Tax=Protomyces lactucae-debilis TaxID=2754530 RepID=A0A1Y2FDB2_PROLT|nr:N-terminal glutamine amidase-domain-containing protein [Protomyces lactucae-debilis]ORY81911.1 N-terminal glutamine amidase-domain-containing protein [Protomyces lactucae-debilis]
MPLDRSQMPYAACYCEENIYHLARHLQSADELYVAIISNADGRFPLWRNRRRLELGDPQGLVVWGYHVILLQRNASAPVVYDFDSDVPWPCPLAVYASEVLKDETFLQPTFHRLFRIISATAYLRDFRSDRSHMLAEDGVTYLMPVPTWPCLGDASKPNSLPALYRMDQTMLGMNSLHTLHGRVTTQNEMLAFMQPRDDS